MARQRDKAAESRNRKAHNKRRVEALGAIKMAAGCADCGYAEHHAALDFDHRPGTVKLVNIGPRKHASWDKLMAEIAKCDVVCSNCHRIRTYNRLKGI